MQNEEAGALAEHFDIINETNEPFEIGYVVFKGIPHGMPFCTIGGCRHERNDRGARRL